MREVLGVIPARGGSRGVPRKNLVPLAGRPLLAYTCDAARQSRRLTRIVLSTDDEAIAEAGRALGVEVPFLRPARLATDDTPMLDVLVDLLRGLEGREQYRPDVLVLLQPTSPCRTGVHIDAAVDLLEASGAGAVVTVVPVPHAFTPGSLLRMEGDRVMPIEAGPTPTRRQDKPRLFARNGPAVVAVRTPVVVEQGRLYADDTRALVMSAEDSVDIDEPFDLLVAEAVLARRAGEGAAR